MRTILKEALQTRATFLRDIGPEYPEDDGRRLLNDAAQLCSRLAGSVDQVEPDLMQAFEELFEGADADEELKAFNSDLDELGISSHPRCATELIRKFVAVRTGAKKKEPDVSKWPPCDRAYVCIGGALDALSDPEAAGHPIEEILKRAMKHLAPLAPLAVELQNQYAAEQLAERKRKPRRARRERDQRESISGELQPGLPEVLKPTVLEGEILSGPLVWLECDEGLRARGVLKTYLIRSFEGRFQIELVGHDGLDKFTSDHVKHLHTLKGLADDWEFEDRAKVARGQR